MRPGALWRKGRVAIFYRNAALQNGVLANVMILLVQDALLL